MSVTKISSPKIVRYAVVLNLSMEIPITEKYTTLSGVIGSFKRKRECTKIKNRKIELDYAILLLEEAYILDGNLETIYMQKYNVNIVLSFPTKEIMERFEKSIV